MDRIPYSEAIKQLKTCLVVLEKSKKKIEEDFEEHIIEKP